MIMDTRNEYKTTRYRQRFKQLKQKTDTWREHWKDLADFVLPRKSMYLTNDTEESNDGGKVNENIINGVATLDAGILANGIGNMTSPSKPWFELGVNDKDLMELEAVKSWLRMVRDGMLEIFAKSNFYISAHNLYEEIGVFGTNAMLIEQDWKTIIRCRPFTIGEFYIGLDDTYRPDTLYRKFELTARQLIDKFGEENVSREVMECKERGDLEKTFIVIHTIEPNSSMDSTKADKRGMAYKSVYFELDAEDKDRMLRESGYKSMPFVAPRWKVKGVDTYGESPGMNALGDIKMLQLMEEKKLNGLEKQVDPPLNAPTSLKAKGGTILSGGINYVDTTQGKGGITPVHEVNLALDKLGAEIERVENRIDKHFYTNIFLSIIEADKSNMTATEIAERVSERLSQVGSLVERLETEFLDVAMDRVFSIMEDMGVLPDPPEELAGKDIKVEYISILSQAQKMAGISSVEQTAMFISGLAEANPEVLDKFDFDEAVDVYASMANVPPTLIRSDIEVSKLRQIRAEQAAKEQQKLDQIDAAQTAKTLSETRFNTDSVLDGLVQGQ
jgi:hypothetical protein